MAPAKKLRCPDCGGMYGRNRHICVKNGREIHRKVYKTRHFQKPLPPKVRFGERNTAIGNRLAGYGAALAVVLIVVLVLIAVA